MARIRRCLASVAGSLRRARPERSLVVVVDDGSTDGTGRVARRVLSRSGIEHRVLPVDERSASGARRAGVAAAIATGDLDPSTTLLLSTDADSVVPVGWVSGHMARARAGALAVAGVVELLPDRDAERVAGCWTADYAPTIAADGTHPHVHAANLGIRLDTYLAVGGFPAVPRAEDIGLWTRLRAAGITPVADASLTVATSARLQGRVAEGFAHALARLEQAAETAAPLRPATAGHAARTADPLPPAPAAPVAPAWSMAAGGPPPPQDLLPDPDRSGVVLHA